MCQRDVIGLLGVQVLTVILMFLKILETHLECCFENTGIHVSMTLNITYQIFEINIKGVYILLIHIV